MNPPIVEQGKFPFIELFQPEEEGGLQGQNRLSAAGSSCVTESRGTPVLVTDTSVIPVGAT